MISECLGCIVGGAHVAVPIARVERLVEYEVGAPLPLAQPWVGGIGVLGPELFVSVRLGPPDNRARRAAKGLLLRQGPGRPRWALEVDRIVGIDELAVTPDLPRTIDGIAPYGWLLEGEGGDGEAVAWLDVDVVEAALSGDAAAEADA
jgi:hypothetical protein